MIFSIDNGKRWNAIQRNLWARSIQPKFPEISVQNSMDRFGPTGKVSKKQVHLLRWSSFPGRTSLNFGWMDRALLVWISGIPLTLEDVWNSGWEIFDLRLYFSWYLPARTANVIRPNHFCYYVQNGHSFLSVIVFTFLISYLLISCWSSRVFSAIIFNLCQKTTMSDLPL